MGAAMHRPFYPESREIGGLGWVVTATPMAVPPPPCPVPQWLVFSHWNSTIGQVTAMSGARHRPVR